MCGPNSVLIPLDRALCHTRHDAKGKLELSKFSADDRMYATIEELSPSVACPVECDRRDPAQRVNDQSKRINVQ